MSEFKEILRRRTATQHFEASALVTDADLYAMLEDASQSPSSFNLQHWRFIVINDRELRDQLAQITLPSNRKRVLQAPLSIVIVGDKRAHMDLPEILEASVQQGSLSREIADEWLGFASKVYSGNETLANEEAIRSCSLAAMTLMLSAEDLGYSTCPVGFNADMLMDVLALCPRYVPVFWITLGKRAGRKNARRPRLRIADLVTFNVPPNSR